MINLICQARKHLKTMVETVIDERKRSSGPQYDDLLAKLLRASESDGGEPLKNEEIVDVVLSSLLAGFDTSANTLLFLVYYIGQHPQVLHDLKVRICFSSLRLKIMMRTYSMDYL